MRSIFLTFLLVSFFNLYSQTGNYFLSHFSSFEERNVCFDIVQTPQGLLYFATRKGVLQYDGKNWDLLRGSGAIYSLQINSKGTLFWSGAAGYGTVAADEQGYQHIKTISTPGVTEVFQTLVFGEKAYFLNDENLFAFNTSSQDTVTIRASGLTGTFTGMIEMFGIVYLNTEQGIFKIEGNKLVSSSLGFSNQNEILFSSGYQNQYLLGLATNRVFICGENLKPREIKLEDQTYAEASVIVSGSWVNRELFVLGTLRGGLIFVNAATGRTQEIINYATGLPDNEVYALMSDRSQSTWVAHEYGFTRISPYLPFRSFSHYTGLQGNLLCAISFQNSVYVGTSLGLFKLEKEEIYDVLTYYIDVKISELKRKEQVPDQVREANVKEKALPLEGTPKKKGILGFLKRNRNSPKEIPAENTPASQPEIPGSPAGVHAESNIQAPTYRREKKTQRVLRKAHYVYKKVNGIDAKITQLINANGHLMAVGLEGVFEVRHLDSKSILQEPARTIFARPDRQMIFIATYKNEIRTFAFHEKGWQPLSLFDNLDDHISYMFEGKESEFWFCGIDKIYRIEMLDEKIITIQNLDFENPNFDNIVGLKWRDKIILVNSQGFFKYDRQKSIFSRMDSLEKPTQYFAGQHSVWYRDLHRWNLMGINVDQSNRHLLNLYKDLRAIIEDQDSEILWLITGNNELYKFFGEKFTPYEVGYPILLKSIYNDDQRVSTRGKLTFDERKSALTFGIIQPEYFAPQSIEYRYQLKGLDKSWSDWSNNYNAVNFPYLPAGNYTLQVQAQDIFGKVKELRDVSFEVLPPYWRRPWFYAFEFMVFASLVILSFRLSTRFRFVSRVLSLLTIILLIQFIQTVIGEFFQTRISPVIDFFMQVFIAFLILPVEGYLRNLMLRSPDQNSVLHKLLLRKEVPNNEGH